MPPKYLSLFAGGVMEGGTAGPLGVPVLKGRKQEAENAITPSPRAREILH